MATNSGKKIIEVKPFTFGLLRASVLWVMVGHIGMKEMSVGEVTRVTNAVAQHYVSEYMVKRELSYLESVEAVNVTRTQGKGKVRISTRYAARPNAISHLVALQHLLQPQQEAAAGEYCDYTRSAQWDVYEAICKRVGGRV
jgi:hypothetical protein